MNPSDSAAVVLLGGGHAHALALPLMAGKLPPGRKLILVSDAAQAPYSGMVPGHIAGHYARRECFINLPRLAEKCGAEFVPDRAVGLDLEKRAVVLEKSGALPFGILSINTGGVPRPQPECFLPEVDCAVKPVSLFAEWLDEWQGQEQTESQGQTENKVPAIEGKVASAGDKVAVIGAGAGGVEVALALNFRARKRKRRISITLLDRGDKVIPALPDAARARILRVLARNKIATLLSAEAVKREPGVLRLADGRELQVDRAVFATPVGPPLWVRESGLELDGFGFISVDAKLQASRPNVFACGDAASFAPQPLPKSGVYAVRQGPHLARNLIAAAAGNDLTDWIPQPRTLAILSAGEKRAVAARGGWVAEGAWVWRWKNFLDRRFMNRFA